MTQKIIQTADAQLAIARGIIKAQAMEIRELKLELSHLSTLAKNLVVSRCAPSLLRKRPSVSEHNSRQKYQAVESPSFARPTRASQLRQSTSPTSSNTSTTTSNDASPSESDTSIETEPRPVVIHGKPYIYKNGKPTLRSSGYLLSTKATVNKFGHNESRREERCGAVRPPPPDRSGWFCFEPTTTEATSTEATSTEPTSTEPTPTEPVVAVSKEIFQPVNPEQVMSQAHFEDKVERKRIEIQTRLKDSAWLSNPSNNVYLDNDETFDILWRAEKLAKRCLWRWLRTHRPEASRGLKYLSDMDFGRNILSRFNNLNHTFFNYRYTKAHRVEQALEHMIALRNKVHHFDGFFCGLKEVENHLREVQWLAVLLYDEESATSARNLRDRLHGAAQEVAQEIETIRLLTALPFAGDYPWKYHHIRLFEEILWSSQGSNEDSARQDYSTAAVESALECASRIDDMRWACEPDIEESLAKVQRLGNGGCGGVDQCGLESQGARVGRQDPPNHWRSASADGPRIVSFRGNTTDAQPATRRGSFSPGGAAEDRPML